MMPENGTVLDIVKWMRGLAESLGTKRRVNIPTISVHAWMELCTALEEAARRDNKAARDAIYREAEANARKAIAGNAAALREALSAQLAYWDSVVRTKREEDLRTMIEAALSVPARNVDLAPNVTSAFREVRAYLRKYGFGEKHETGALEALHWAYEATKHEGAQDK